MDMYNLCVKIEWEQTRQLSTGVTVPTGCEVRIYTWRLLMGLVMISIGGQVFENFRKVNTVVLKIMSSFRSLLESSILAFLPSSSIRTKTVSLNL